MSKQIRYVPILKWKAAEITALENISAKDKRHVRPLIELVLPSVNAYKDKDRKNKKTDEEIHSEMVDKMIEKRFVEIPEEIQLYWGNNEIYVDTTLLHNKDKTNGLKIDTLNTLVDGAKTKELKVIPVVNIADDTSIIKNVRDLLSKELISEICVRVTFSGLKDLEILDKNLFKLLELVNVPKQKVHLLVDLKYLDPLSSDYEGLFDQAQKISDLKDFKEIIFASGSFPVDMSECPIEEITYLSRTDWMNWRKNVTEKKLVRIPVYSDYSIRHPFYNDSLQFFESTSTLKYTLESQWMIWKGKKRALGLYLTHASLLVLQPEFNTATYGKGKEFSFGDNYIYEKAEHFKVYVRNPSIKGTGRTQDWIAAGISHHIALVIHQLSSPLD